MGLIRVLALVTPARSNDEVYPNPVLSLWVYSRVAVWVVSREPLREDFGTQGNLT